jgi:hypothetical protein
MQQWRTPSQALPILSYLQCNWNQTTTTSIPSGNYYAQIPGPSKIIWGVVLLDTSVSSYLTPGWGPAKIDGGTAAQLSAECHRWEEAVVTFRTWNTVEQALKKQIITVFEPMHLKILNNDMVGFDKTTLRDMLEHLFLSYGSITTVDLEHNFENMRKVFQEPHPSFQ